MKLIIDISEDVYTRLFDNGIQDNEIATDDICEMARSLRLGIPLPEGAEILTKEAYSDLCMISADVPNFESEKYIEHRLNNYNNLLKSGILDCCKDGINERRMKMNKVYFVYDVMMIDADFPRKNVIGVFSEYEKAISAINKIVDDIKDGYTTRCITGESVKYEYEECYIPNDHPYYKNCVKRFTFTPIFVKSDGSICPGSIHDIRNHYIFVEELTLDDNMYKLGDLI